jgi:hypothetical protein
MKGIPQAAHSVQRCLHGTTNASTQVNGLCPTDGTAPASMCIHGITMTFLASRGSAAPTTLDAKPKSNNGKKLKPVKAIFCPTLHFSQPVAVEDDDNNNNNRDLSNYEQLPRGGMTDRRFGSKPNDLAELNYRPNYEGTKLTFMYVTAGEHRPTHKWLTAVNVSAHGCSY